MVVGSTRTSERVAMDPAFMVSPPINVDMEVWPPPSSLVLNQPVCQDDTGSDDVVLVSPAPEARAGPEDNQLEADAACAERLQAELNRQPSRRASRGTDYCNGSSIQADAAIARVLQDEEREELAAQERAQERSATTSAGRKLNEPLRADDGGTLRADDGGTLRADDGITLRESCSRPMEAAPDSAVSRARRRKQQVEEDPYKRDYSHKRAAAPPMQSVPDFFTERKKRAFKPAAGPSAAAPAETAGLPAGVTVDLISDDDDCDPDAEPIVLEPPPRQRRATRATKRARKDSDAVKCIYNPNVNSSSRKSEIVIHDRDYELLEGQEFLNDTLIDFYFKMLGSIKCKVLRKEHMSKCCFFSSLFIRLLMSEFKPSTAAEQDGTSRAHNWAKNYQDLFEKDFWFIPVHRNLHWSLAVVIEQIRKFISFEWKARNPEHKKTVDKDSCQGHMPVVPLQSNDWDCGLFVLHYAEMFAQDPTMVIECCRTKQKLDDWFKSGYVQKKKRDEVKALLDELVDGHSCID